MSSHHTCCNREKVKRGLWSPEEDEKLINYVSTYGHGCWSTVPRLAGLQRCGKSCRLRWINYLRPDVKRGNFSPQEAALIIELHRILGNRWSHIAKYLPGRTDNEVKNFWNSSIKKKLLAHARNCRSSDLYLAAKLNQNLPNFTDGNCSSTSSSSSSENRITITDPQLDSIFIPIESGSDPMLMNHDPNFFMDSSSSLFCQDENSSSSMAADPSSFSNFFNYPNQEIPTTYDFDKETLEALLLELNPDKSAMSLSLEAPLMNMNPLDNGFIPLPLGSEVQRILHPYHIDNITAMMENFTSPATSRDML